MKRLSISQVEITEKTPCFQKIRISGTILHEKNRIEYTMLLGRK